MIPEPFTPDVPITSEKKIYNIEEQDMPKHIEDTSEVNEEAVESNQIELLDNINSGLIEEKTEQEKKIEEFEKHYEKKLESIEKYRTKFDELLDVLYDNGSVQMGENLLNYLEFKDRVEKNFGKKFSPDDIRKFLTICNLLEITSLSEGKREALLNFKDAKEKLQNYFQK